MGARSDLVDRVIYSRGVSRIKSLCSRVVREPDSAQIILVVVLCILTFVIVVWMRDPKPVQQNSHIKIRPMVSPQEMRNVLQQAESSRRRR